jgi:hypothetical protein
VGQTTGFQRQLRLPGVILEGGRRGWVAALVAGAVLGGAVLVIPTLLSDGDAFGFFAVFLGMLPGAYFGFAVADGRDSIFRVENVGVVIYITLGVLSLSLNEPMFLVAGYVGHGLWSHPSARGRYKNAVLVCAHVYRIRCRIWELRIRPFRAWGLSPHAGGR